MYFHNYFLNNIWLHLIMNLCYTIFMIISKISQHRNLIITAFVLWLGHFFVDFMISIWAVYKTMAHIDLAIAGLISTFCAFTGEGMQLVFGSLSDKGYRKPLIALGILSTAGVSLLPYTDSFTLMWLLFLITCLGSGAFHLFLRRVGWALKPTK